MLEGAAEVSMVEIADGRMVFWLVKDIVGTWVTTTGAEGALERTGAAVGVSVSKAELNSPEKVCDWIEIEG